jgi:serine/threonine protein kinase
LHLLSHENILPLRGIAVFRPSASDFVDGSYPGCATEPHDLPPCIVTPWMSNGSMYEYLTAQQPHSSQKIEQMVRRLKFPYLGGDHQVSQVRGIADGLAYLHSMSVVHGDLRGVRISLLLGAVH